MSELQLVVRAAFEADIAAVSGGETLPNVISDIIGFAERTDKVDRLIAAAIKVQPTNHALNTWNARWGPTLHAPGQQATHSTVLGGISSNFGPAGSAAMNPQEGIPSAGPVPANPIGGIYGPSKRTNQPSAGSSSIAAAAMWERVLEDAWRAIWDLLLGRLGNDTRDQLRQRLAEEVRARIDVNVAAVQAPQDEQPTPAWSTADNSETASAIGQQTPPADLRSRHPDRGDPRWS